MDLRRKYDAFTSILGELMISRCVVSAAQREVQSPLPVISEAIIISVRTLPIWIQYLNLDPVRKTYPCVYFVQQENCFDTRG